MGVLDVVPVSVALMPLSIRVITSCMQAGVLTGDNVRKLFDYAKENKVSGLRLRWRYICGTDGGDPLSSLLFL
jgi:hypothetical protein